MKLWGRAVPSASPVRHNGCNRFPTSNRQISTNPISSAFIGRYFSLAAPMRRSISQLKSPQVLSHLLLVVAIFPLPHPCAIRFPRSNRQISTNPISSAFIVVAIFPLPHPCAIRFLRSNRQIPTSPISSAFTRGRASWLPLPILFFNGKLPEAMWETAEVHSETGYRQQQGDTRPASRVASR